MVSKAFTLAILALSVLQCANAGYSKKYESKGKVYQPVYQQKVQAVHTPVVYHYTCVPKPVILTAAAVLTCPAGSTAGKDGAGALTCFKVVCTKQPPKVVYVESPAKGHYGYKKSKSYGYKSYDKKDYKQKQQVVYVQKHPVYVAKVAAPAKVATYVPVPDVCSTVKVAPVYVCEKGTLSGKVCNVGTAPGACPAGWTADKDKCIKAQTVTIQQQVAYKPQYKTSHKGYYGYGKAKSGKVVYGKYDKKYYDTKYGYQSKGHNYCEESYGH